MTLPAARVDVDQQPSFSACYSRAMADRTEHQPGAYAPITGHFEELNIFGSPTGKVEHVHGSTGNQPKAGVTADATGNLFGHDSGWRGERQWHGV